MNSASNSFSVQVKSAGSPDGTAMPPSPQIISPDLAVWTSSPATSADRVAGQIAVFRNGVRVLGSVNYVQLIRGVIYAYDPAPPSGSGSGTGWLKDTGGGNFISVIAPS